MFNQRIKIASKWIGKNDSVFVIAEAGVNHNGNVKLAKELVRAAKEAGADAVKFQSFVTEETVSVRAPKALHQLKYSDQSESQYEMIKKLELSDRDYKDIINYAEELGIIFMATPYDIATVDWLDEFGVAAFKIASMDVDNVPFLRHVAAKKKPIILSTGMSYLEEIAKGLQAIREVGNDQVVLLHCTSNYPTSKQDCNLRVIETLRDKFIVQVGYSDHTEGNEISLFAICIGARIIEKHFTVNKSLVGPDHKLSLDPWEFKDFVDSIRSLEVVLGSGKRIPTESELQNRKDLKRSIFTKKLIKQGEIITFDKLAFKRPGIGIAISDLPRVIGKKAVVDIDKETMLAWQMIK
jgi:N-acetylneuraminate synthase